MLQFTPFNNPRSKISGSATEYAHLENLICHDNYTKTYFMVRDVFSLCHVQQDCCRHCMKQHNFISHMQCHNLSYAVLIFYAIE